MKPYTSNNETCHQGISTVGERSASFPWRAMYSTQNTAVSIGLIGVSLKSSLTFLADCLEKIFRNLCYEIYLKLDTFID